MLYQKARPERLEDVIGNRSAVRTLMAMLRRKEVPHALLVQGESGCGKTTIARIMAKELGAGEAGLTEINAADFRGIDDARELAKSSRYSPLTEPVKVFIIDECFVTGTLVSMADGSTKAIESAEVGDLVVNKNSVGRVTAVMQRLVRKSNAVRVYFSSGTSFVCSRNHRVWTDHGWVYAGDLTSGDLCVSIESVRGELNSQGETRNGTAEDREDMRELWKGIYGEAGPGVLRLHMLGCLAREAQVPSQAENDREVVRALSSDLFCEESREEAALLHQVLRSEMVDEIGSFQADSWVGVRAGENLCQVEGSTQEESGTQEARSYQVQVVESGSSVQGEGKTGPRSGGLHVQDQGGQWKTPAGSAGPSRSGFGLGYGVCGADEAETFGHRLSYMLQDRHSEFQAQDRYRGRWSVPQLLCSEGERCQEGFIFAATRVDRVEVYEQENSSGLGFCGEGDRCGDQNLVMYDLEVSGHPSFFANGILVHNCQQLTAAAQNTMLKPIEDCAAHSYFMFCTTDPEKLIATIRNRCTVIQVGLLTEAELRTLVTDVCKRFKLNVSEEVKEAVIQTSEGCPRAALVKLEAVEHITDLDEALAVVVEGTELQKEVIDLCRLIASNKSKWSQVAETFKALSVKDCEKVRYAILGYLKSCLLRSRGEEAAWFAAKLKVFCESTFYSGEAGLVRLLWEASQL